MTMDVGGAFTDRLLEQAELRKGTHALDVGCGSGDVALRLAKAVGDQGHVLGIDVKASVLRAPPTDISVDKNGSELDSPWRHGGDMAPKRKKPAEMAGWNIIQYQ